MRYRSEHKERVRRRILTETVSLIRTCGLSYVSLSAVMSQVGMTVGGFYLYFDSKAQLLTDAIDELFEQDLAVLRSLTIDQEPAYAITAYIDRYLGLTSEANLGIYGCNGDLNDSCLQRIDEGFQKMHDALSPLIAAVRHCPQDAARSIAYSVVAELYGAVCIAEMVRDGELRTRMRIQSERSIKCRIGLVDACILPESRKGGLAGLDDCS